MDNKKLALIHIVKRELGLSDDQYREILRQHAGVESAKDLTDESFRRLMRFLVRSRHYRSAPQGVTLRQKLYIQHLRDALGWDNDHLTNYIHKYFKADSLETLTRGQASKAILALTHITEHRSPPRPAQPPPDDRMP